MIGRICKAAIAPTRLTSASISAAGNFSAWMTSKPATAAATACSIEVTSMTSRFSGAERRNRSATAASGMSPRKARCSGNTRIVSDRPSRCMIAPPALTAATANCFAPGTFLRVQATAMSGFTVRAARTIAWASVATPDQISIRVCATFQLRSKPAAAPSARRIGLPFSSTFPLAASRSTLQPVSAINAAASSASARTIRSRATNCIWPGAAPIPSASVVRSP